MAIIIFGDLFTFPDGNAATNRVYTYAKGFLDNNTNVYIICFRNEYVEDSNGIADQIRFYHPLSQKRRNKYFLIRRWQKLKKYYNTYLILKRINKKEKINAIICYSMLLQTQSFGFILSKIFKCKILQEVSEHPFKDYQGSFYKRFEGRLKVFLETKFYNGIICISQYLIEFYLKKSVSKLKLFLVPSTVDPKRFQNMGTPILKSEYILYCGHLNLSKDGVDILIQSFAKISGKFQNINLVLIGSGSHDDEVTLKNIAAKLNIKNRVIFLGQISRTKVPNYLVNAKILALSRPESIVADAGFPSKLTEYLATGKPVVVTKVGEISKYLTDSKHAFLSKPGDVEAFSEKLNFVLDNYEFSYKVGLNGKELTSNVFNYKKQAARIIEFINSL